MKDGYTPLATPFALQNDPHTPSKFGATHYFETSHRLNSFELGLAESYIYASKSSAEGSSLENMPSEILSLILELGYMSMDGMGSDEVFRTRASHISRKLRDIALHSPSLWSVLQLSPSNVDKYGELLPIVLERSKDYPLSIFLDIFWVQKTSDWLMDQLLVHSRRWRRLHITIVDDHVLQKLSNVPTPLLEDLSISHFSGSRRISLPQSMFGCFVPKLSELHIRNIDIENLDLPLASVSTLEIRGYGTWPSISRLRDMLADCRSLKRLIFHVKPRNVLNQLVGEMDHPTIQPITIPNLLELDVFTSEWLSRDLSSFLRVFHGPRMQRITVLDNAASLSSVQIMTYSSPETHPFSVDGTCKIYSANIFNAWTAMSPSYPITNLEIRKAVWPGLSQLRQVFASLNQLRHLVLLELDTNDVHRHLTGENDDISLEDAELTLTSPLLATLRIEFDRPRGATNLFPSPYRTIPFIRLFKVPSLSSLSLRYLTSDRWYALFRVFSLYQSDYPALRSLSLADMPDVWPRDTSTKPSDAFPHLQELILLHFPANPFIQCLASDAWPEMHHLTIRGDANVSKPLLHRALSSRANAGRKMQTLVLDKHFSHNLESWSFIKEHANVVEMFPDNE